MNELLPPPAKKSSISKFIIPVVVIIAGVAALGYFASKAGLDRAIVQQEVDAWIERSKAHAAKEGYNLAITYESVAIKGGLTDGHALISNIKVISAPNKDGVNVDENSVTFTTAEVKLEPKSANLRDVAVILPTPVHVFEGLNAHESASLMSDAPLEFDVEQIEKKEEVYNRISHELPSKITLRFLVGQDAVGEEDMAQELTPRYDTIEVSMESGKGHVTTHHQRPEVGNSDIEIHNLKVVPIGHEEGTVTVDNFSSKWSNELNDKNLNVIDADIKLDNLRADERLMPYSPINAAFSAHFEGAMPSTPEEFAKIQSQQTSFKLNELSFSTKDASINATADFVANQNDILPVGMANISITNVQAWRDALKKNDAITTADEEIINTLFIRILGITLPSAKDVTLDIQRAREGSFQIGLITFEELLAILLRQVKTPLDVELPALAVPVDPVEVIPEATEEPTPAIKTE